MLVDNNILAGGAGLAHLKPREPQNCSGSDSPRKAEGVDLHIDLAHLYAWLASASRSKLAPFTRLARTPRRYRDGILAAVTLRLSNARLEGPHSKVRLLSHRSFGFHTAAPLIALIYLCCAAITINPPLQ